MSQRREVEARLSLFNDLSGILGAMRSFALAELRRVNKREAAQQQVVLSLSAALDDLAGELSLPEAEYGMLDGRTGNDIWLLFGSVRGFCGSFNEDVLRCWQAQAGDHSPMILLGERLHPMLEARDNLRCINGANGGLDAPAAIDRILAAIAELRDGDSRPFGLWACVRDEQAAQAVKLWPLAMPRRMRPGYPPLTNAPIAEVAGNIAEYYLFHNLLALLLRSIKMENHMRLIQMETALRHLDEGTEEMLRLRNRLRQEEIVEEIELMAGSRTTSAM